MAGLWRLQVLKVWHSAERHLGLEVHIDDPALRSMFEQQVASGPRARRARSEVVRRSLSDHDDGVDDVSVGSGCDERHKGWSLGGRLVVVRGLRVSAGFCRESWVGADWRRAAESNFALL